MPSVSFPTADAGSNTSFGSGIGNSLMYNLVETIGLLRGGFAGVASHAAHVSLGHLESDLVGKRLGFRGMKPGTLVHAAIGHSRPGCASCHFALLCQKKDSCDRSNGSGTSWPYTARR